MYSDVFCKVYNELGWNVYPEVFGQQLLLWLQQRGIQSRTALDLACGTGILCQILRQSGIRTTGVDLSEGMIRIAREADPQGCYEVADMVSYCPSQRFDLVTCTGDALNHIRDITDVKAILGHVYECLNPDGYFIFDILNEHEISTSEPFEMDFGDSVRVWFQMTRPEEKAVNLRIRVYEDGKLAFEENIRETVHDPVLICDHLRKIGFADVKRSSTLLDTGNPGTTWFVTAQKPRGNLT